VQGLLTVARGEIGVTESKQENEDWGGRIRAYRQAVTGPGYSPNRGPEPWCADFVSWVFKTAGRPLGPSGQGYAYVPYLKDWLVSTNQWRTEPQPGDIVVFNWQGPNSGVVDHVGIVERVESNGITTIEGNTGDPNRRNPEGVYRKRRYPSTIEGYGRIAL
jgi:hypothetical protein